MAAVGLAQAEFVWQSQHMYYSPDEKGWIERKAREIRTATGWPLPIATSEAMAEFWTSSGYASAIINRRLEQNRRRTRSKRAYSRYPKNYRKCVASQSSSLGGSNKMR